MHVHESEVVQVLLQQNNNTADQARPADVRAELERLGVVNQMIVAAAAAVSDLSLADDSTITEGNSTFAEGNTILFIVDEVPVVVLVQKGSRVAVPDLAAAFGVRKKRVRLARADECVTYTGIHAFHCVRCLVASARAAAVPLSLSYCLAILGSLKIVVNKVIKELQN